MNQKRWTDAAERFREKRATQKAQEEQRVVAKTQADQQVKERQERYAADVKKAADELFGFISSPQLWIPAKNLLAASERHIVIAEENEGGGSGVVYFIDGNGLQKSVEAMGMWMAYAQKDDIPKPNISSVDVGEVARLAIRQGVEPHQIVERIRQQLDRLAEEVL